MERLCKKGITAVVIIIIVYIGIVYLNYEYYKYEGVRIYTNRVSNSNERNLAKDGYNLGKKWQCVEFVKRFYYKRYDHKMPNSYGHAISFYNVSVKSGEVNKDRDLIQIKNNGKNKPCKNDIIIVDSGSVYGHVAIVSKVEESHIEVVQQNHRMKRQKIKINKRILGWLRLKNKHKDEQ